MEWYRQDGALGKDADNYADRVSIDLHYCGESCEEVGTIRNTIPGIRVSLDIIVVDIALLFIIREHFIAYSRLKT